MSTVPHILVLCADPGIGWSSPKGASVHLRSITEGFLRLGFQVSVLTCDGIARSLPIDVADDHAFAAIAGLEVVRRYHRNGIEGRAGAEIRTLTMNPFLHEAIRTLHRSTPLSLIYERYSLWSDLGARAAEEFEVPLVLEVNAPLIREQARYRQLVLEDIARQVETRVLATASRVITVSGILGRELTDKGVPGERVRCLPNIAERARFECEAFRTPVAGEPFRIGFSGSLKPWHGLSQFLEVFRLVHARAPQCRLEILGDGKDRAGFEAWVRAADLTGAVTFRGHVPQDELADAMSRWHLAVAPYPKLDDFYFSPLKIADALAAGRPVMASAIGEIPEMLGNGDRGMLVTAGDWPAWEARLLEVLADPARLEPLARAAERATRGWSWTTQARRSLDGLIMIPKGEDPVAVA